MLENQNDFNYQQLILKINLGTFNELENKERIIFLSKGILIALNYEIIFYDYKRYCKKVIKTMDKKEKEYIKFSKLLDDRFCIHTLDESSIYQFNNDDFTITCIKKLNINLNSLIEIEKDIFINKTDKYIYFWKKLKPIYKSDQMAFLSLNLLISSIIISILIQNKFGFIFNCIISIYVLIIIMIIIQKNVYLFNPYKRFKINNVYNIEKCGNNLCCIKEDNSICIFDYKNYKIINKIVSLNEGPVFWNFFIINENIILLIDYLKQRMKIYDIKKNKVIKSGISFNLGYLDNTIKIEDHLFVSIQKDEIIKWKYYFNSNDLEIINRTKHQDIFSEQNIINQNIEYVDKKIIGNKLFVVKLIYLNINHNNRILCLSIYK